MSKHETTKKMIPLARNLASAKPIALKISSKKMQKKAPITAQLTLERGPPEVVIPPKTMAITTLRPMVSSKVPVENELPEL